jgi:C4-dicarboxylate-specific signal transduction histidine kinase
MLVLDRLQIGAALLALLENALQHAPEAGTLVVGCALRGHRLEITVADDGPGISPEMAARLFEPFATGRANGTGLGLAIAQAAAKAAAFKAGAEAAAFRAEARVGMTFFHAKGAPDTVRSSPTHAAP